MRHLAIAASLGVAVLAGPVAATTITFDDLPQVSPYGIVPTLYQGFMWSNVFYDYAPSYVGKAGYANSAVSGSYSGFTANGTTATITGAALTFNDGYFTSAWNDGLTVTVQGYVAGVPLYTSSFTIDTSGATYHSFGWVGLTSVTIVASGGTPVPAYAPYGNGPQVAFDNLRFNEALAPVPEAATWVMTIVGVGAVGGAMRRRRVRMPAVA